MLASICVRFLLSFVTVCIVCPLPLVLSDMVNNDIY